MRVELILKEIRGRKGSKSEYVASGACKDYIEYSQICGAIEELTLLEAMILDALRKEESLDE